MKRLLFIISLVVVFCSSCEKKGLHGGGQIDSTVSYLKTFDNIHIYNIFDVKIEQDSFYRIKIIGDSELLKKVEVKDDTALVVRDLNKYYFSKKNNKKINLIITVPDLSELIFHGAGTFRSDDTLVFDRFLYKAFARLAFADFKIKCSDHLFVELWNVSGSVKVEGEALYFGLLNHGAGNVDAYNLKAQYTQIEQRSSGYSKTFTEENLRVKIFDIGNVYYKGFPKLDTVSYYKGRVIDEN